VNVPINQKRKLGPKIVDYIFLGYAIHSVGYRFLIINYEVPDMHVGTIMESRDAIFFENEFFMKIAPSTTNHESIIFHEHKNFIPVEHVEEPHTQNPEEDDKPQERVRDRGLQSPLVMTILCTLWMIHQRPLKRHIPLLMLTCGREQYGVRLILLCLMELGKLLIVLMDVNL
jgi:hypothetical protein